MILILKKLPSFRGSPILFISAVSSKNLLAFHRENIRKTAPLQCKRRTAGGSDSALSKNRGFLHICEIYHKNKWFGRAIIAFLFPSCQLFQIHGCKLKPYQVCYLCKTSTRSISHCMPFFRISRHPLYFLFSHFVQFRIFGGMPNILRKFYVVRPYMLCYGFYAILWLCA